jgi:hypothetical protein
MNITCKHCGGKHALFWHQGVTLRNLSYICDKYQQRRNNRNTGYSEIRRVTKRLVYHEATTAKEVEGIPTVYSKPVLKKEADEQQEKFKRL